MHLCRYFSSFASYFFNHILILFNTDVYATISMSRTKTVPLLMNLPEESSKLIKITITHGYYRKQ